MSQIDQLYYINLDYRTDRRGQIEEWLEESKFPDEKVTRMGAAYIPGKGYLGCTISHIETLKAFLESSQNICCVMEDDFQPHNVAEFWNIVDSYLAQNIPFDMLMLSSNMLKSSPTQWNNIGKVEQCFTSSGQIITRTFAPKLITNLEEGLRLAQEYELIHNKKANEFCLDVYWQKLMPSSNWFAIIPSLGYQRASYSDIEGVIAECNV